MGMTAAQVKTGDFAGRPVQYAEQILGITTLTSDQKKLLSLLHEPPYRILAPSCHDSGKTYAAAVAISYWYDSFNPGAVFTIGPRQESLKDTVWGEVRRQRAKAGLRDDFIGPAAPEMRSSTDHWAKAFTAAKDASLTGRHLPRMLFIIEEAVRVDPIWWEVIQTMFDPALGHAMLCPFNPTDTSCQAFVEDQKATDAGGAKRWHRVHISALDHPNIVAELAGRPRPIPHGLSLEMVQGWVDDWTEAVDAADREVTDVEWPPASGSWRRPGPIFQSRGLGLWPDTGSGVWSPALYDACTRLTDRHALGLLFPANELPCIGADCATGHGDDFHAIHCRWGRVSVHHETANTMNPVRIFQRLKVCAQAMADLANTRLPPRADKVRPQQIPIKIDDDGTGGAVGSFLAADGYTVVMLGAGCKANDESHYPNRRSELWFVCAGRGRKGLVNFGLLDETTKNRLRLQLITPTWKLDGKGRQLVEPKDKIKDRIGRSPDDADAVDLAYYEGGPTPTVEYVEPTFTVDRSVPDTQRSAARERGLFGRR